MKSTALIPILLFFSTLSAAGQVEIDSQILLIEPNVDGKLNAITLSRVKQIGGNFEMHSREGRPDYRGVPWNLKVFLGEAGKVRVVFWIDDKDYRLDEDDETVIDQEFDATSLETQSFSLLGFDDGSKLKLLMTPSPIPSLLKETQLTASTLGLNFFCLKNSAVVVDENYFMGSFTGFGEKLVVGIPGLALVNMSFLPIHDWTPIGIYENGVIEVPLAKGHQLSVLAVKIGPNGLDQGGPFTIYGLIEGPVTSIEFARELLDRQLVKRFTGNRLKVLRAATANNPYGHLGRGTIGTDSEYSDYLVRVGGVFGKGLTECSD